MVVSLLYNYTHDRWEAPLANYAHSSLLQKYDRQYTTEYDEKREGFQRLDLSAYCTQDSWDFYCHFGSTFCFFNHSYL